jgi:hypothetical protein
MGKEEEEKNDTPPLTRFGSAPNHRGHVIIIRRDYPSIHHAFTCADVARGGNFTHYRKSPDVEFMILPRAHL